MNRKKAVEYPLILLGFAFFGFGVWVFGEDFAIRKKLTRDLPIVTTPKPDLPCRPEAEVLVGYQPIGAAPTVPLPAKHNGAIFSIAASYDDTLIASASSKDSVKIQERATGREVRSLPSADGVNAIAFTHDDRHILSGGMSTLRSFATDTGVEEWSIPTKGISKIVVTKDDKTVFVATRDGVIHELDIASKRHRGAEDRLQQPILSLALSPDEKVLAAGSDDGSITLLHPGGLFNVDFVVRFRPHAKPVDDLAFSPDGKLLASGSDDGHVILTSIDGKKAPAIEADFNGGKNEIWSVAFSPDGKLLAFGMNSYGWLGVIDVASRWYVTQAFVLGPQQSLARIAFTHDGRTLLAGRGDHVYPLVVPRRGLGTVLPESGPNASGDPAPNNDDEALYLSVTRAAMTFPDGPYAPLPKQKTALAQLAYARAQTATMCWDQVDACDGFALYDFALPALAEVAKTGPLGVEYWSALAMAKASNRSNTLDEADEAIKKAYAIAPRDPYTVLVETWVNYQRGQFAEAVRSLGELIRSTKRKDVLIAAWRQLARNYSALGDVDATEGALKKRQELATDSGPVSDEVARFYVTINEPAKALPLLGHLPSYAASDGVKFGAGDEELWTKHRPAEALALYDGVAPNRSIAHVAYSRAVAYHAQGKDDLARKELIDARGVSCGVGSSNPVKDLLAELKP